MILTDVMTMIGWDKILLAGHLQVNIIGIERNALEAVDGYI